MVACMYRDWRACPCQKQSEILLIFSLNVRATSLPRVNVMCECVILVANLIHARYTDHQCTIMHRFHSSFNQHLVLLPVTRVRTLTPPTTTTICCCHSAQNSKSLTTCTETQTEDTHTHVISSYEIMKHHTHTEREREMYTSCRAFCFVCACTCVCVCVSHEP